MLDNELAWLSMKLGDTPGLDGRDYVFGHCDLLSGNVIVQDKTSSKTANGGSESEDGLVSFIDYEYATPSPAAFDIANHFAEWAGFDCDHGAVPTKSQRLDFLKVCFVSRAMPCCLAYWSLLLLLARADCCLSITSAHSVTIRYRTMIHKR